MPQRIDPARSLRSRGLPAHPCRGIESSIAITRHPRREGSLMREHNWQEQDCHVYHDEPCEEQPMTELIVIEDDDTAQVAARVGIAGANMKVVRNFMIPVTSRSKKDTDDEHKIPGHVRVSL